MSGLTITCADDIDADGPGSATTGSGGGGSFPTTSVLDNFNRANEGPPPSASWGGVIQTGNGMRVASNKVVINTAGIASAYWGTTYGPDTEVFVTIQATVTDRFCVFVRLASVGGASPTGYFVWANSTNNTLGIFRMDGGVGTRTQLGTDISQTVSQGDSLGMSIVGSTIKIYYKVGVGAWTLKDTQNDATYSAAGKIGIMAIDGSDNNGDMDDFGGGTI